MTNETNNDEELDSLDTEDSGAQLFEEPVIEEESATVPVTQLPVDAALLRKILEGAILAAGQPMTIARLLELFDEEVAPTKDDIAVALADIQAACEDRGFELKEVASGWRFQVRDNLAPWVNRLWEEKPQKYSRALLETLSLIAYRQPITRGDIEEIRGVAVSSHIIKTLLERDWVKVVGHRDVPGRPSLYATTRQFLDYFNLKSLEELPSLSEIRDLDELNPVLDLGEAGLGEKDTDPPIPDATPAPNTISERQDIDEAALYEEGFVDGEEAFVDVEDEAPVTPEPSTTDEDQEDQGSH
ncbi:SMC-Scp complex subunit ScpB [Cellvibrio mixtus]|uniref:SMC-Scp complex subunit ScpB n=1 Tax=Cellvibrio mixtus TaxID=39650 RepID=UPI000A05434F|nr:SMC-Scp complex subunit ScpB [Cellvibrio mixtus]